MTILRPEISCSRIVCVVLVALLAAQLCTAHRELQVLVSPDNQQSFEVDPSLILQSPSLPLDNPLLVRTAQGFQPEGIHVPPWKLDGTGWTMLVSWQTGAPRIGNSTNPPAPYPADIVKSVVDYGLVNFNLTQTVDSVKSLTYTYIYDESCGGETYHSPIIHHAALDGLLPGTTYFYRVGSVEWGFSDVLPLQVPPSSLDQGPVRIGLISDLGCQGSKDESSVPLAGQTVNSSITLQQLTDNQPHIVFLPGDLSYADNHATTGATNDNNCSDQRRWDSWARMTAPLFSRVPLLTANGNHEVEVQLFNGNKTFMSYNSRYPIPQDPDVINTLPNDANLYLDSSNWAQLVNEAEVVANNSYYSIGLPGAHLISLSNYISYGLESRQFQWFLDEITSVDREITPWLFVQFHTAPYHTYNHHFKEIEEFMQQYEPVFLQYGVDVVFSGHLHSYERSFPTFNYTVDTCAPMYICIGDGGNMEGLQTQYIDEYPQPFCDDPSLFQTPSYQPSPLGYGLATFLDGLLCPTSQPPHSAFREPAFGHGMLTLFNATHAQWDWVRNQDNLPTVTDSVIITKNPDCALP